MSVNGIKAHLAKLLLGALIVLSAAMSVKPTLTYAGGGEAQLYVLVYACTIRWVPGESQEDCFLTDGVIQRVEGYNQNDEKVVWNAVGADNMCYQTNRIEGWWWKFEKGVNITVVNEAGETAEVEVKTHGPVNARWARVGVLKKHVTFPFDRYWDTEYNLDAADDIPR